MSLLPYCFCHAHSFYIWFLILHILLHWLHWIHSKLLCRLNRGEKLKTYVRISKLYGIFVLCRREFYKILKASCVMCSFTCYIFTVGYRDKLASNEKSTLMTFFRCYGTSSPLELQAGNNKHISRWGNIEQVVINLKTQTHSVMLVTQKYVSNVS